jgi:phosphate transport system permease protein
MTLVGAAVLAVLIFAVFRTGGQWLSWEFLNRYPSRIFPEQAGLKSALFGTLWVIGMTACFTVPVGMAAAVYLHEYAKKTRLTRFIELNIANLAGVPSIVYGILGLAVFVRICHLGRSVVAGALTLSLLILPVVIIASREALASVPDSFRQAAFGVGATRWQVIRAHVLPSALPGMMTGVILALSRAIGEAAPLLVLGALTFITFVPQGPLDSFTAMPIQIFNWCDEPDQIFQELAAAGIIVMLGMLLPMNAIAVGIRAWHQRRKVW